jgi:hypothetical protein
MVEMHRETEKAEKHQIVPSPSLASQEGEKN